MISTMTKMSMSSVNPRLPNMSMLSLSCIRLGCRFIGFLRAFGKAVFQTLARVFCLLEKFTLLVSTDEVVISKGLIRIMLDGFFHDLDGKIGFLMNERDVH